MQSLPLACLQAHHPCWNLSLQCTLAHQLTYMLAPLQVKPDRLQSLPAAFVKEGGSITAGNSSMLADGAAALVLVSAERASELGLRVWTRTYVKHLHESHTFRTSTCSRNLVA